MNLKASKNFAIRLREKFKLTIPVNVEELATNFAKDIKYIDFPNELDKVDGVTINLKNSKKDTRILINKSISINRKRFTLAHEIGHIVIPWHTGTIIDHTSNFDNIHSLNEEYQNYENEANTFASELLIPSDWVNNLIKEINDIALIQKKIVEEAKVSAYATCFKLKDLLKSYICIIYSPDGTIKNISKTHDIKEPNIDRTNFFNNKFEFAENVYTYDNNYELYSWIKVQRHKKLPNSEYKSDIKEIQNIILNDISNEKLLQSVNGIIGHLNSHILNENPSQADIYNICLKRFANRPSLEEFTKHYLFNDFLIAKTKIIYEKKQNN